MFSLYDIIGCMSRSFFKKFGTGARTRTQPNGFGDRHATTNITPARIFKLELILAEC
jgi:hypothetical protein